jgi:hypothetical protein
VSEAEVVHLANLRGSVILAGDFNAHNKIWNCHSNNARGNALLKITEKYDFSISHPDEPTRVQARCNPAVLDFVIANNSPETGVPRVVNALKSDHLPIYFEVGGEYDKESKIQFDYSKAKWHLFKRHINRCIDLTPRTFQTEVEIETAAVELTETILTARRRYIPKIKKNPIRVDLNDEARELINTRNQLRKDWNKARRTNHFIKREINTLQGKIKKIVSELEAEHWDNKLKDCRIYTDDPRNSLWALSRAIKTGPSVIKPLRQNASSRNFVYSDLEKADALADAFVNNTKIQSDTDSATKALVNNSILALAKEDIDPDDVKIVEPREISRSINTLIARKAPGRDNITNYMLKRLPEKARIHIAKIFNACLLRGYFPKTWKTAHVVAIAKPKKDHSLAVNYRPISLLDGISKLFEKVILRRFLPSHNQVLPDTQYGFRKGLSTTLQLSRITGIVMADMRQRKTTGMVLLDLEKAFDTVWHDGLIHKLFTTNMPVYITKIIQNYLSGRALFAVVKRENSSHRSIDAGVPQGSLMGPRLFNHFISDMPNPAKCTLALYADDTAILSTSRQTDNAIRNLEKGTRQLTDYFSRWRLKVNAEKTEAILFSRSQKSYKGKITVCDIPCSFSNTVKYLGVYLHHRLNWTPHLLEARRKAFMAMGVLRPIFNRRSCLSEENKKALYSMVIKPTMLYASPIWTTDITKSNLKMLQTIENRCLRIVYELKPHHSIKHINAKHDGIDIAETITKYRETFLNRLTEGPHKKPTLFANKIQNFKHMRKEARLRHKMMPPDSPNPDDPPPPHSITGTSSTADAAGSTLTPPDPFQGLAVEVKECLEALRVKLGSFRMYIRMRLGLKAQVRAKLVENRKRGIPPRDWANIFEVIK